MKIKGPVNWNWMKDSRGDKKNWCEFHFFRDCIKRFLFQLEHSPTSDNLVDILTNPLGKVKHEKDVLALGSIYWFGKMWGFRHRLTKMCVLFLYEVIPKSTRSRKILEHRGNNDSSSNYSSIYILLVPQSFKLKFTPYYGSNIIILFYLIIQPHD